MFNKTEGAVQNIAGRVQEAFGMAMGDTTTRLKGRARRIAGGAQYGYGDAVNRFRESAVTHPIATIAVIGGLCFLLGAIWARREDGLEEDEAS